MITATVHSTGSPDGAFSSHFDYVSFQPDNTSIQSCKEPPSNPYLILPELLEHVEHSTIQFKPCHSTTTLGGVVKTWNEPSL